MKSSHFLLLPRILKECVRRLLSDTIQPHKIVAGPLRGDYLETSWRDYPSAILGIAETALLKWFASNVRAGETWLDVGAHYGYTAIALSRLVGESGRVFAFEPVQSTAACLARTRAANALEQLTVVPIALGDQPSQSELCVRSVRGMADSTLTASESLETIFAVSLDAYWPELAGSDARIHGIKVDVQGMELQVLRGMLGLLTKWAPKLIVEFHRGVNREHVIDLLLSVGYSSACQAMDGESVRGELADDNSYFFEPEGSECAFSSTRSITVRS